MWIGNLTIRERRAFWACFGGWTLDAFDVTVFAYAITGLISIRMLTKPQAGILGTTALLLSSLGGWIAGILCDRYGRVRVLQVTIAWFAVFTFLSGLAQNYWQLLVLRSLQGLGFGGEWTAGALLMGEVIRAQYRGRAVGTVQAGYGLGAMLAAVAYGVVFSVFPAQWSWRILFFLGILPALLVVYVRRYVQEPEIFRKPSPESRFNALDCLKGRHLITTILTLSMVSGFNGSYYVLMIWLPQFLKSERHLSVIGTSGYTLVVQIGSFVGFVIGAHLADYIGRRPTIILFCIVSACATFAYSVMAIGPVVMLFLGFMMGALSSGRQGPTGAFLTELYPTSIRGTAMGFVYNGGRAVGGLCPAIVGYAAVHMKLGLAIGVAAVVSNGISVLACLFLPETRNRELLPADLEVAPVVEAKK
jgi:MFS family permease